MQRLAGSLKQDGRPDRVLFVCTGNLCRSPMAAGLARAKLADTGTGWAVFRSAGFAGENRPADAKAVRAAAELGSDISDHRSNLVRRVVRPYPDLIVCMTRQHLRSVTEVDPGLLDLTFTLSELAELVGRHGTRQGSETLSAYLKRIAQGRSVSDLAGVAGAGDIPDPIGRSLSAFRRCAVQIDELVTTVVAGIWRDPAPPTFPPTS